MTIYFDSEFDRIIRVPNPDTKGRQHILEIHMKKKPLASDVDIVKLVEQTDGFSGRTYSRCKQSSNNCFKEIRQWKISKY